MDFLTLILVLLIFCGVYYYFKKKLSFFEELGIPYSPGLPFFGIMLEPLLRRKHFCEKLLEVYNMHPNAKYIGAFDFNRPVIVLRDLELIKNVTIKNFDNFPDHVGFFDENSDPLFGSNLFNMTGDRWKEARNLLSPAFTSSKMKGMFELMTVCAKSFIDYICELPENEKKMLATKDLFTKYTSDVIATCAFGLNVDSLRDPKNAFYVLGRKATDMEGINSLKIFLARAFPRMMKFLKITFINKQIGDFFKNIVKTTVTLRDEKGLSRPDMIQLMMDARGKDNKLLKLDITEMTAQVFIFFFGGFDTTSTQMCLIAHELAINPKIQRKLQEEVDKVMEKSNGEPTYDVINEMPYSNAVFMESLRLHTQVFTLDRLCRKSFELPPALPGGKSIVVEPGMAIWILPGAMNRDSNYYDNPDVFDPDRFCDKRYSVNDMTNIGFGYGPRSCIGNRFAILETKILMFFLLSRFTLKPNEKTCSPLRYSKKSFMPVADGGFWLSIERRKV